MFILDDDYTITIKCQDEKWRTFYFSEIDFDYYIKTELDKDNSF